MITYIKYPIKKEHLSGCKIPMFCIADKIDIKQKSLTVYPKHSIDSKGNVLYPKENAIGFYCKSMKKTDILKFKGGFNIEKCPLHERVVLARKWYFETKQNLPRKYKKKLLLKKNIYLKLKVKFDYESKRFNFKIL